MPIEAIAITNSTATGMSVSCSGVSVSPNGICTIGPNGITAKVTNAGIADDHRREDEDHLVGGLRDDVLLQRQLHAVGQATAAGRTGRCTLGPMRCCIRATTRRSHQMLNSVSSTRITKISTALMMTSHHGSWPKALEAASAGERRSSGDHRGPLPSTVTDRLPGEADGRRSDAAPGALAGQPRRRRRRGRRPRPAASTEPAVAGQRDRARRRSAPSAAQRGRGRPARTGVRAVARRCVVAVLHPAVVEQLLPGGEHEPRRSRAASRPGPATVGAAPARGRRPTGRAPAISRRGPRRRCGSRAATCRAPRRCRPAPAGRAATLGSCRTVAERAGRGPPSRRRCRPCR